jgi:hypothetical protein
VSGNLSFEYDHYPLAIIGDNGTDLTPASGDSYIWGGDVLGTASSGGQSPMIYRVGL